jgi:hypothetical protein
MFLEFRETMQRAWHCPMQSATPFAQLDQFLRNMARFLQSWSTHSIGSIRMQSEVEKEVVTT